jgi:hypothetical protein
MTRISMKTVTCIATCTEQNYCRRDNLPAFPKMAPQAPRGMLGPGELNLPGALLPSADNPLGGRCPPLLKSDFFQLEHRRKSVRDPPAASAPGFAPDQPGSRSIEVASALVACATVEKARRSGAEGGHNKRHPEGVQREPYTSSPNCDCHYCRMGPVARSEKASAIQPP